MANSYAGGMNRTDFFAVKSDGTVLVTVTPNTMVPTTTAATAPTNAFLKAIQNYSSGITPVRLNKGIELSFDQDKFGGDALNALDVFQAGDASANTEFYEDASEAPAITSSGATVYDALAVTYIRLDPDNAGKTLVLLTYGNFKEGSGAFTLKKGERIKPKVDFVSKKTSVALTVDKDIFDATLVTVAADITFPASTEFVRSSLTTFTV